MKRVSAVALAVLAVGLPRLSAAQIVNGGFEAGGAGWGALFAPGSDNPPDGRWWLESGGITPLSGLAAPPPASGSLYAISDQNGPGAGVLFQTFTIAGPVQNAWLSFDMFINNSAVTETIGSGFDFVTAANQHGRVDLLSGIPGDMFTLGSDLLFNMFIGGTSFGWTHFSINVGQYLQTPGTYTLRFGEVDNQLFFNMGVDNVALDLNTVPEPATLTLVTLGSMGIAAARRRRRTVA
jgi:hypothetical protein